MSTSPTPFYKSSPFNKPTKEYRNVSFFFYFCVLIIKSSFLFHSFLLPKKKGFSFFLLFINSSFNPSWWGSMSITEETASNLVRPSIKISAWLTHAKFLKFFYFCPSYPLWVKIYSKLINFEVIITNHMERKFFHFPVDARVIFFFVLSHMCSIWLTYITQWEFNSRWKNYIDYGRLLSFGLTQWCEKMRFLLSFFEFGIWLGVC